MRERLDGEGTAAAQDRRGQREKDGELIDDALAFSRIGRREAESSDIDMNALAASVFEEIKAATEGRAVEFNVEPLPHAWGDRSMVRQVLANLLANAVSSRPLVRKPVFGSPAGRTAVGASTSSATTAWGST